MAKIKDLLELIKAEKINEIEFEDYNGNTLYWLKDFDIVDTEKNENGWHLRLQLKKNDSKRT